MRAIPGPEAWTTSLPLGNEYIPKAAAARAAADILTKLRLERDWGDMACSA